MSRCSIKFSNGQKVTCDTLDAAVQYLFELYPDAAYSDGDGDVTPIPTEENFDEDGCILVWATEADSVDDAGSRAVASIDADTD